MSRATIYTLFKVPRFGDPATATAARPSLWCSGLFPALLARLTNSRGNRPQMPAPERSIVFQRACTAVRSGRLEEAKNLLEFATATSAADAGLLNLLGVVYEARRDWRQARKLYGRAIRADGKFAPARQNMRRWYELFTFGCTEYPILLGDEPAPSALEEFLTHPRQKMTPF